MLLPEEVVATDEEYSPTFGEIGEPAFPPAPSIISTAELRRRLTDPGLTIVDVRPLWAYNGWRASGEARGGHIPGAVAFPSGWLSAEDAELARMRHSKGNVPN